MARRYFPDHEPVGTRIQTGEYNPKGDWYTIVGVVGNVKYEGLGEKRSADDVRSLFRFRLVPVVCPRDVRRRPQLRPLRKRLFQFSNPQRGRWITSFRWLTFARWTNCCTNPSLARASAPSSSVSLRLSLSFWR